MRRMAFMGLITAGIATAGAFYWLGATKRGATAQAATCSVHHLPRDACPFCNKEIAAREGWCGEHGVAEALCWVCKPALVEAYKAEGDWCAEHNLPESHCALCNPSVVNKPSRPSDESSGTVKLVAAPEKSRSQQDPSVTCTTGAQRVQFRSPAIASQAGLGFAKIENRPVSQTLDCNAEAAYNGNRYARISARAPGVVRQVSKDVGDAVTLDEPLAVVDSVELAAAKAEYLQAAALVTLWEKNHARKHPLFEKGIVSEKDDLEAENKVAESQISLSRAGERLHNLGLSKSQLAQVREKNDTGSTLVVSAPFNGIVVDRSAVIGELVDTTRSLFEIADTTTMWAIIDVYEADAHKVRVGQPVVFVADGLPGESTGGRVTWVSTRIDPKTRTLKVRAEIEDRGGLLKANMFGRAQITIHDKEPLLVVPKTAVQWDGCCNIAFVKLADALFEPRKLRLGCDVGEFFEIKEGLTEAEVVVTQGSFLLKTEILKGSIGAGCCEPASMKKDG